MPTSANSVVWNNLRIEYVGPLSLDYALDSKDRNAQVKITNLGAQAINNLSFQIAIVGLGNYPATTGDGGFAVFPNGGNIDLAPGESYIAQNWLSGIYETRFGNAPPLTGETKSYTFDFILATDNRAFHQADPTSDASLAGKLTQTLSFTHTDPSAALSGNQTLSGQIALPNGAPPNLAVEVATPYSAWYDVTLTTNPTSASFSAQVPARDDWLIRITADGYSSQTLSAAELVAQGAIQLQATPDLDYGYHVGVSADAPVGFWRGIASETEQTFVLIPGQENWSDPGDDAADAALRATSLIQKYRFDGTLLWEYAPGWETWGGDMSADGSRVVYLRNPDITRYDAGQWKLGVLDGRNGSPLWSVSGSQAYLEGLEAAISDDARFVAAGSTQGALGLHAGDSGALLWQHAAGTYGQVRKLVFSGDHLYVGSGDGFLVKLVTQTGAQVWKTYVGGWPFVNGLSINDTAGLIAVGTKSKDTSVVDAVTGEVLWLRQTGALDAALSGDGAYVANFYGDIFAARTGELVGQTGIAGVPIFTPDNQYLMQADRGVVSLSDLSGKLVARSQDASDTEYGGGEQAQWAYLSANGATLIVASRDMDTPGERGLTLWSRGEPTGTGSTGPMNPPLPPNGNPPPSTPIATAGNDLLYPIGGDQIIDGGAGIDTVAYAATRSSYTLTQANGGYVLVQSGSGSRHDLINVERLQFSDKNLALDVSPNGNAAQSLMFIGTVAHALKSDPGVIGTILYFFDQDMSMQQICQLAIDVNLISALAGSSSNEDLAKLVWRNVVGVEADDNAVDLLLSFMDGRNAAFSQAQLLATVAQLDLNQQHVGLVGLANSGLEYLPFAG
jgi:hypothetical protein